MLEDYREVLIKHGFLDEFQWIQVKEKYGTLRLTLFGIIFGRISISNLTYFRIMFIL